MWKKLLVVGIVAAVAVGFGGKLYTKISSQIAKHNEESVEDTIASLREETAKLDKDINTVEDELAKEIVEVRHLSKQVTETRSGIDADQKVLTARGEAIKDGTSKVKYGSSTMSVSEANAQFDKDVKALLKRKKSLESMEKALAIRERNRDTLKKQRDELVSQKQEMTAEIDAVEAEYKELQLAQIEAKHPQDDSRLSKIKEGISKLKKNKEIKLERQNMAEKRLTEETAVTTPSVDQNLILLNGGPKADETAK